MKKVPTIASVTDQETQGKRIYTDIFLIPEDSVDLSTEPEIDEEERTMEALTIKQGEAWVKHQAVKFTPADTNEGQGGDITTDVNGNLVYTVGGDRPEIDDFMNDLYVNKIFKDIREYNPEYSLIAWLNPWAVPIFQETKKKELGQSMSQYYQNVGIVVTRATRALEKAGNYNPTDLDIYEYIRDNFPKKEIGLVTVQRVRAQNFTYESLDQKSTAIADTSEFANPERAFISKEKTESFEEAKDSLSERNRLIIEMEQEYVRQQGEMPPIEYITIMLQKHDPSLTEKKVARMINSAHQELKRKYKRKKYAEAPVNNMASAETENSYMEEDEMIIMEAIEEDISLLDI